MKRNKLQKTVFSVICIVLAVIMMLSLVITVLPAHAVDETDLERLAEKRAQLEEQLMEQEQVIQGLTENQTLIVFRKAALDKQISLNRETIALIEEQIAVYQELIDRKEEELAAATAAETEQTALLRERIRSMEENDSYSYLAFIFEADSVPEILARIADVNDIMHYDRELEKSLQQSREDVETIKREYEEAKAEQDAVNEELIARRDQLSAQVTAACELIANLDELSQNAQAEYDAIALAEDEAMQELLKAMQEYAAQLAAQRTSYSGSTGGGSTPSGTASSGAGTSGTGGAYGNTSNASGAYTGEIAANMLVDAGCKYVILGHSERRSYYGETDEILVKKVQRALENNLDVIFCVGEVLAEREAGKHFEVVKSQLVNGLFILSADQFTHIVVAYEPVWAIGTGKTATSAQAGEMHAFIRKTIADKYGKEVADNTSILYGGSCNPKNADELFSQADVDGGLIGGASLKADDFMAIITARQKH